MDSVLVFLRPLGLRLIYDPENRGHFGLALQSYAHFTTQDGS
ncbi:hypothetical protein OUHCRE20_45910 [Enterobacter hormaechei subsp. steigerwaltii]